MVSLITVVIAHLSWRGWISGVKSILRGVLLPRSTGKAPPEVQPLLATFGRCCRNTMPIAAPDYGCGTPAPARARHDKNPFPQPGLVATRGVGSLRCEWLAWVGWGMPPVEFGLASDPLRAKQALRCLAPFAKFTASSARRTMRGGCPAALAPRSHMARSSHDFDPHFGRGTRHGPPKYFSPLARTRAHCNEKTW